MHSASRRALGRLPLCAAAALVGVFAFGCAPKPLTLRADVSTIAPSGHLRGQRVAVVEVQDLRKEAETVGGHRDGVARVTQHGYELGNDPRSFTQRLLELMLLAAGAELVHPTAAQLRIAVGIEKLEITTDAPLAGEETFGRVEVVVSLSDAAGRSLGTGRFYQDIADEDQDDAGMLGDGLRDVLAQVVAALRPQQAMPSGLPQPGVMPQPGAPPPAPVPAPGGQPQPGVMPPAPVPAPTAPAPAPAPTPAPIPSNYPRDPAVPAPHRSW
jgi:hypothetical protein